MNEKFSRVKGILPLSEKRDKQILSHSKNNPVVKICRTKFELERYTRGLLKEWNLI